MHTNREKPDAAADQVATGNRVQRLTPLSPGALSRIPTVQSLAESGAEEAEDQALQASNCEEQQPGRVEPPEGNGKRPAGTAPPRN